MTRLEDNKTLSILAKAAKHGYCVPACNVYSPTALFAVLAAAEKNDSPAIINLFPWALHCIPAGHSMVVKLALMLAKESKVPISVHLDHCQSYDDVLLAIDLGFDSIMVDMSHYDHDKNVRLVKELTQKCHDKGISVEAEMGRIDGAEDGVAQPDMEGILTQPNDAVQFIKDTGVDMLAPAIGNMHGFYPPPGPQKFLDMERLCSIYKAVNGQSSSTHSIGPLESTPLVLHGFSDFPDSLVQECIKIGGIRKINVNRTIHETYQAHSKDFWTHLERGKHGNMTEIVEQEILAFENDISQAMKQFGSRGKANL